MSRFVLIWWVVSPFSFYQTRWAKVGILLFLSLQLVLCRVEVVKSLLVLIHSADYILLLVLLDHYSSTYEEKKLFILYLAVKSIYAYRLLTRDRRQTKQFCFLDADCLVVGENKGSSRRSAWKYPVKPPRPEDEKNNKKK